MKPRYALAGVLCTITVFLLANNFSVVATAAEEALVGTRASLLSIGGLLHAFRAFWDIVGPGGKLHPAYFLEHKGHLVIEGALIAAILYLALQHSFKVHRRAEDPLTEKEVDQLCQEWSPEPLVPTLTGIDKPPEPPVIERLDGPYVYLKDRKEKVLHLAWSNYLNQANHPDSKDVSLKAVDKYGVGSCGPRGFYGTIDVHLDLEKALAEHYGTESCIIYSYDVATIASIIPAFANRKDIIIVDEFCSYPIQSGCNVSRARVATFKHNNVADLRRVIEQMEAKEKAMRKPLCRKLIVVEGIYSNYGDMAPLDEIFKIKEEFKYRLMVDESHAFGVLGKTGCGACEHFNLKPGQVEIITASMSHAMGSVGGFCLGDRATVEHQRLSGSGYCFSASLPPYLAVAGINMLKGLRTSGGREQMERLQAKIRALRSDLSGNVQGLKLFGGSKGLSPILHFHLAKPSGSPTTDLATLRCVADHMLDASGVLAAVSQYSMLDTHRPPPSLIMYVNVGLGEKELKLAAAALRKAASEVIRV